MPMDILSRAIQSSFSASLTAVKSGMHCQTLINNTEVIVTKIVHSEENSFVTDETEKLMTAMHLPWRCSKSVPFGAYSNTITLVKGCSSSQ
jgi:hypothetical protein